MSIQMLEEEEELQKLMSVQDLMMDDDENAFAVSSVPCMCLLSLAQFSGGFSLV